MKRIVSLVRSCQREAFNLIAVDRLKNCAEELGHQIRIETPDVRELSTPLSVEEIIAADLVIIVSDSPIKTKRFAGKSIFRTTTAEIMRDTKAILETALGLLGDEDPNERDVILTGCLSCVSHAFVTTTSFKQAIKVLEYQIKAQTQEPTNKQSDNPAPGVCEPPSSL